MGKYMESSFKKPEVRDVYTFLREHNAIIAHFSGTPKGAGSDYEHAYPDDLYNVVNFGAVGGASCSVVLPADEFTDLQAANATGCIGVVLGLRDKDSLVAADPHDCGSRVENGIRKVPNERDVTVDDLKNTLVNRPNGSYNEWVLRDYTVLGIIAARPFRVSILKVPDYPDDMPDYLRDYKPVPNLGYISIAELLGTFPDLPIFSFCRGTLQKLTPNGIVAIDHAAIYEMP